MIEFCDQHGMVHGRSCAHSVRNERGGAWYQGGGAGLRGWYTEQGPRCIHDVLTDFKPQPRGSGDHTQAIKRSHSGEIPGLSRWAVAQPRWRTESPSWSESYTRPLWDIRTEGSPEPKAVTATLGKRNWRGYTASRRERPNPPGQVWTSAMDPRSLMGSTRMS